MGFLQDNLLPFIKNRELRFIERVQESGDVYSFMFEKSDDLSWKAGQYGLFNITHTSIKNGTRPLSLSSAPVEGVVRITTRIGKEPSAFKRSLLELTAGMTLRMRGPVGPFYLKDENPTPTLLIAAGIGITPFRSMLRQAIAERHAAGKQLHLLYMDGSKHFLFKQELDEMAAAASLPVTYVDTRDVFQQELRTFSEAHKSNGSYYVAGPKAMVDTVSDFLKSQQVASKRIKKDAFWGY